MFRDNGLRKGRERGVRGGGLDTTEAQPYFPPHHHSTLGRQSSSKTIGTCKRSRHKCSCDLAQHTFTQRYNIWGVQSRQQVHRTQQWARHHGEHRNHAERKSGRGFNLRHPRRLRFLLSGGTLSLCGQPDRLRWWGYRPVTWPVPSQPGVGHRLSFLSAREASVGEESHGRDQARGARENIAGTVETPSSAVQCSAAQRNWIGTEDIYKNKTYGRWCEAFLYEEK